MVVPRSDLDRIRRRNPGNEYLAERIAARVAYLLTRTGFVPETLRNAS